LFYVFGVLLIAHGLIHTLYLTPPLPAKPGARNQPPQFNFNHSWLIKYLGIHAGTVKVIGMAAVIIALVGFVAAGLGVLGVPGLVNYWQTIAIASASSSLILLIASWNNQFIVAVAINIAIAVYAFIAQ
jgi:hypothetical protein